MNTPGDKQGAASAGAVDDVDRIVLMKVHFRFSIDAMTALVRTGEVPDATHLPPCDDTNWPEAIHYVGNQEGAFERYPLP